MSHICVIRTINAPVGRVFDAIADVRLFSDALPHATGLDFLTEIQKGLGTRFRQTRVVDGRESVTELEVTEYEENDHVRMVADDHGTVWDTLFEVAPDGDGTLLTTTMEARAYKILPKLIFPFIKGMVTRAIEKDMDLVKAYCERA